MFHPMIVHLPLGLAAILPLVGLWLVWFSRKEAIQRPVWILMLLLQLMMTAGAFMAVQSGEKEEHRVEDLLPEAGLHEHEERAELLQSFSLLVLAAAGFAFSLGSRGVLAKVMPPILLLLFLLQAGMAVATGKAGGELVWDSAAGLTPLEKGRSVEKSRGRHGDWED
jgi:uncharacterized membrane protein